MAFADPVLFPDGALCATGCTVDADCGDVALGCSQDARFTRDGTVLGVCVPALGSVDATCGRVDGALTLCTSALRCFRAAADLTGTCGTPDP